jgi:SNF family Na+-dependent transporter
LFNYLAFVLFNLISEKVWAFAAIQNFNSIGVAFGGLISMSSYNPQKKKILGYLQKQNKKIKN